MCRSVGTGREIARSEGSATFANDSPTAKPSRANLGTGRHSGEREWIDKCNEWKTFPQRPDLYVRKQVQNLSLKHVACAFAKFVRQPKSGAGDEAFVNMGLIYFATFA